MCQCYQKAFSLIVRLGSDLPVARIGSGLPSVSRMVSAYLPNLFICTSIHSYAETMAAGYIVGSLVGSFGIAYLCDTFVSDKKAFGG
jgi:hypothetical protein